eukprot:scaffold181444_cov31-Tisochrysis_lutea.AAC.2
MATSHVRKRARSEETTSSLDKPRSDGLCSFQPAGDRCAPPIHGQRCRRHRDRLRHACLATA